MKPTGIILYHVVLSSLTLVAGMKGNSMLNQEQNRGKCHIRPLPGAGPGCANQFGHIQKISQQRTHPCHGAHEPACRDVFSYVKLSKEEKCTVLVPKKLFSFRYESVVPLEDCVRKPPAPSRQWNFNPRIRIRSKSPKVPPPHEPMRPHIFNVMW